MPKDVCDWVDMCFVCIQFRKRPQKVLSNFFTTRHRLPWHHVLIDFEGPITPVDLSGGRYTITYTCLVCSGTLLVVLKSLCHSEVRRAMLACVI